MFKKVEDTLGRLAGTPLVVRGSPSFVEGGPGHYTHLLHIDLQDVNRRQEIFREDHAKLFLVRSLARGVTWGNARRVNYRVPTRVLRRARHMSPLAYQHGPSDPIDVSDDATFVRLSICGATIWVQILAGLRDLADLEAWQLCIYVECAVEFPAGAEVLLRSAREHEDLLVLG